MAFDKTQQPTPIATSPKIDRLSWGKIEINGKHFKDAKLFPGGAREWNWQETGTRHVPGIQAADVAELIDRGATTIVLSRGMLHRLQVCPETLQILEDKSITAHVLQTELAVKLYNSLVDIEAVGGLFHSTC
ncbi:Mth938-like domain-containing protein [Oscillatoriales cyanobacterium LEGE 11467]|uniref:Mth938-like domain-containing protein n=1 Tax=Zarconia navalis LEGE 11467 TaxID=1828826 RepID=A0A928Z710_9CYAN|nr:Mth938-like domain-containing protein [Zarconia navalis]MBE9040075.1 Mth938-like domain-containing protein [Zarconia navalis LEGE 11467]